jgi:hypothetical protein
LFRALGFRRGLSATPKAAGFLLVVVLTYISVVYVAELVQRRRLYVVFADESPGNLLQRTVRSM